jgi:putative hemolysin
MAGAAYRLSGATPSNVRFDVAAKEIRMKVPSFPRPAILGALILAGMLLAAGTTNVAAPSAGTATLAVADTAARSTLGNPAAVYCKDMGYDYHIEDADGQRGFCTLPDGQACDAWEYLQGKCGGSYSYCVQQGYEIRTLNDGQDPFSPEYAVCVTSEGVAVGSVTELSNLSEKATGCGNEAPVEEMPPLLGEGDEYVPTIDADPPPSFDWRTYLGFNWLSPVKNQGNCGSCWSFSAVGVTEAALNIANNNPNLDMNLSEQYLVADCSSAGTCCGGNKAVALQYIMDSGVPDEGCMPYVDGTGCTCGGGSCDAVCTYRIDGDCSDRTCANRCGDWSSRLTHITSTGYVGTNPQTIKQALVDIGPLAVSMGWGSDFGGHWDGDIYRCTLDTGTNHAVVAVGYNDAGGYWIIKNSWGTGWEDGGYFKIGYGECYIEQYVYYADAGVLDVGPLVYDSHLVDDDTIDQSDGNDDGIVDCGETIELYVDLYNQGADTATGVSATISTSDPYVTWPHNTDSTYPDIPAEGTGTNSNDYDFEVAPGTPDGHVIHFDLEITAANGGPWTDSFDVPVTCSSNNPPYTPSSPSPADGASGVPVTADLAWAGGDPDPSDTVTYDVYLGTTSPPTPLLCNATTDTTCDPGTLSLNTTYYWYVVATDDAGASTSGPVWHFTITGGDAYEPDNTWEQATLISDGSPQTHSIVPAADVDWVMFTLSAESEVVIETSGASGDTRMWLYDSDLTELEYDNDGGADSFSRIDRLCGVDALPAGIYYVQIDEFGNNAEIPSYEIAFTVQVCASGVGPLVYHSHLIDDDTYRESFGDDDGIVDCGEKIELYVDLFNQGTDAATLIDAAISTSDPYVGLRYNTDSEYPDIPGGGTGTNTDDFDLEVDPGTPDGHVIHFDLVITAANGGLWTDSFDVPVTCSSNNPPYTPSSPSPADGASGVPVTADLSWTGGDPDPDDTVTYAVYFGTTSPPTPLLCNDTTDTTCNPGSLSFNTPYYWYVVATDNAGASTTGPIWHFTTESGPTVGPLQYDSHLIDDDTITSDGDGDGMVDCGEAIELNITLMNQGTDTATGVTASLATTDPLITITDSQEDFGDIAGGGTGEDIEDYDFVVDPATPHGHAIAFELSMAAANGGPWSDFFEVPVECAASCIDPGEPNDEASQAVPISYGNVLTGRDICLAGDVDYYSFYGAAGDMILADIDAQTTGSLLDSYLILYGPDEETELTHNDDFEGLDSLIAYTLPAAGTYYLKVREYNHPSEGGPAYTYQIGLTKLDSAVYLPLILRDQD